MKVLIDTEKKTIKLEEKVQFKKLQEFVKKNELVDYEIEPETITVKEKEYYPYYPYYPIYPYYRDRWWEPHYTGDDVTIYSNDSISTKWICELN